MRRFDDGLAHHDDDDYEDGQEHEDAADRDGHHGVRWCAAYCEEANGLEPSHPFAGMKY